MPSYYSIGNILAEDQQIPITTTFAHLAHLEPDNVLTPHTINDPGRKQKTRRRVTQIAKNTHLKKILLERRKMGYSGVRTNEYSVVLRSQSVGTNYRQFGGGSIGLPHLFSVGYCGFGSD